MSCLNNTKLWIILFFIPILGYTQENRLEKADVEYRELGYIHASEIYEKVASKGYRSSELLQRLGNSYYFNADYQNASKWYMELIALDTAITSEYYRRYAQSLKAIGKDLESQEIFKAYRLKLNEAGKARISLSDYLKRIEANSGRYELENLTINSKGIDFGGHFSNGKLLFASSRNTGRMIQRRSSWEGLTFLNAFEVEIDSNGAVGDIRKLNKGVNTRFHTSSSIMTADGKTLYFTGNNGEVDDNGIHRLKIFRATLRNGKWRDVEELIINSDNYSTAHPALNKDEDKLYFVSDRPGSYGESDIYVVEIHSDGSLGKVQNMGSRVNTPGRESFPFITQRDELYFSSDGHFGLGGYDVFYIPLDKDQLIDDVINVGKPINSQMDDFAFTINTDSKRGYVSSNRDGGKGYDDIYSFTETKDIREVISSRIYGHVLEAKTLNPLADCIINLINDQGEIVSSTTTDESGYYELVTDRYMKYVIHVESKEHGMDEATTLVGKKEQKIDFTLARELQILEPGVDLAQTLRIDMIYFDFDKWSIREDAEVELQKVLTVLKEYPMIHIDIHSHTDSRGNEAYNQKLSKNRAMATMNYLIENGVSANRLSAKGFGETQPLHVSNKGKLPEELHQKNRRSEFIISPIDQ